MHEPACRLLHGHLTWLGCVVFGLFTVTHIFSMCGILLLYLPWYLISKMGFKYIVTRNNRIDTIKPNSSCFKYIVTRNSRIDTIKPNSSCFKYIVTRNSRIDTIKPNSSCSHWVIGRVSIEFQYQNNRLSLVPIKKWYKIRLKSTAYCSSMSIAKRPKEHKVATLSHTICHDGIYSKKRSCSW